MQPLPAIPRRSALTAASLGIVSSALPTPTSAASPGGEVLATPDSGGSLSFDGVGGHLSVAVSSTTDLVPGTGDYTIEWWMKEDAASTKGFPRVFNFGGNSAGSSSLLGISRETSSYQLVLMHGGGPIYPYPVGAPDGLKGAWHHLAVCRASGEIGVFLDGTRVTDATNGTSLEARDLASNFSQTPFRIGVRGSAPTAGSSENFHGLITDFRYVIGRALYTGSTLTVPTSPLPAVTGTALLFRATTAETLLLDASGNGRTATAVDVSSSTVAWSSDSPYLAP